MTVRTIGRTEKAARASLAALAVMLVLGGGYPALAQTETPAPAPAPAPTPAPSSTFRLPPADDGRASGVQGPSDNGLPPLAPGERRGVQTPAPAPRTTPPTVVPTRPATPTPAPAATSPARRDPQTGATPAPRPAAGTTPAPVPSSAPAGPAAAVPPTGGLPTSAPAVEAPSPATPGFSVDPTEPVPSADADTPPADSGGGTPLWAWLLAGLAAAGAGIWYWRRRPALAGAIDAGFAEPAVPEKPQPAARAAAPAPRPAPAAPRPTAPVAPAPLAPSPLVTRPMAERRAQVAMTLDIRGIRMTPEQLIVAFTLGLRNEGPVAATGLMVRIALNQGSAMTEPVLARFFDGAGGSVLRDDMMIAPGAGDQLSTEVMLPRASVEPLMIGGKPMLIPVLVFDVTYHWDGEGDAFGQNAGSFVLGREQGESGSDKLAPLPLDRPNLMVNRPGARTTAMRRNQ
ncbi:hypothetical protein [Sphingopyxis sp.]|uniref:hypothetical protein n=1 Tax=Sphingopyxis sp. TaxID=1908224 RepID=UPI003D0C6496